MLNYIWGGMIVLGIGYAAMTGNMEAVSNGAIDSAKEAITLCITMLGVMGMWTGLMEIATKSGLIEKMTKWLNPFVTFLFPNIPKEHVARKHITSNIIANIFGLGWAATPAGLKAMEALAELNEWRENATNEMCTFLIINISSLQLIPINIIAYRSQYGSVNPAAVIVPGLIATTASTLAGIIYCKWKCREKIKA